MRTLTLLLTALLCTIFSHAQIANIIPYQGQIADTSGAFYDGDFDFQFRILNSSNSQLWSSGSISLEVNKGTYSVHLGESPQTALPQSIWNTFPLFLEISFDDGTNGMEALSPNVQILPVPFAMRSAYADSAASSGGDLQQGDSLVLRDNNGDVRFVLNPNSGQFRMMKDDTSWLTMSTRSPLFVEEVAPSGAIVQREHLTEDDGTTTHNVVITYPNGVKTYRSETTSAPDNLNFYSILSFTRMCPNDDEQPEYTLSKYRVKRDTTVFGIKYSVGVHVIETWFDCSTKKVIRKKEKHPDKEFKDFNSVSKEERIEGRQYVRSFTTAESSTGAVDTFDVLIDAKTGEVKHSNEWIEEVRKYEKGRTVATYEDKETGEEVRDVTSILEAERTTSGLQAATYIPKDSFFTLAILPEDTLLKGIHIEFDVKKRTLLYDGADNVVREQTPNKPIVNTYEFDTKDLITEVYRPDEHEKDVTGVGRLEYDGLERRIVTPPSGGDYTESVEDGITSIEQTFDLDNSEIEFTGLNNVHYDAGNGNFISSVGNTSGDEISVLYEPKDGIINYDGINFVEWQTGGNIATLGSLGQGSSVLGYFDPNASTNFALALTMDLNNRFMKLEDPFGAKIPVLMDTLIVMDAAEIDGPTFVNGTVSINGNLNVNGNISKQGGSFKIDHPDDPYNRYLVHSFVESPDMMNVYNGNIVTNDSGIAVVTLPDYFESLNMDFRYQLTCLGQFAQAIILQKVENNQFVIQTNKPGVEVSWQITGIRKDPYAQENRLIVEEEKPASEKGTLLYTPQKAKR